MKKQSSWLKGGKEKEKLEDKFTYTRTALWFAGIVFSLELRTGYASMPTRYAGNLAVIIVNCLTASQHLSFVSFQRQLGKNIKFGQPPPNAIPMKKADRGQARLEEELFLTSPMETVTQDVILSDIENKVRLLQEVAT